MNQNMYNPKNKISLFFLSSIAIMLAEIQGETKRKQEDKRSEDNRKQENGQTLMFFKTALFGYIYKENQHIHFVVHGHSSWSTFNLHLVRAQKLCN